MAAIASGDDAGDNNKIRGTLMEFHLRFGHLAYDAIEFVAKDPNSGITLTSTQRKNCLNAFEPAAHQYRL